MNGKEKDQYRHQLGYEYAQSEYEKGKTLEALSNEYQTGLAFDEKDDHFDYGIKKFVQEKQNAIH